jgi:hypothetical protein
MKIQSYEFVSMPDPIGGYGVLIEDESRPGIDGHTFRDLGRRGERFQFRTISTHNTQSLAKSATEYYEKLKGSFVIIQIATGDQYSKILVHNVRNKIRKIGASTDGSEYIVESTWDLQRGG